MSRGRIMQPSRRSSAGYSSGSDHEGLSSVSLAEMVNEFIEEQNWPRETGDRSGACEADEQQLSSNERLRKELIALLLHQESKRDVEERKLVADVQARVIEQADKPELRAVMSSLRAMGYNAAVCKSRWSQSTQISQGEYAYIDVLVEPGNKRFIVDTEFSAQFEIARPSEHYLSIFSHIPPVFVGTPEQLQKLLRIVSDAMKLSLKRQELLLPPWRKPDYLRAKWFSTYKRTNNSITSKALPEQWQPDSPRSESGTKKPKAPGLSKLLTEAGLIRRDQVAHQLVTVVM